MQSHVWIKLLLTVISAQLCAVALKLAPWSSIWNIVLYPEQASDKVVHLTAEEFITLYAGVCFVWMLLLMNATPAWSFGWILPYMQLYLWVKPSSDMLLTHARLLQLLIAVDSIVFVSSFLSSKSFYFEYVLVRCGWIWTRVFAYGWLISRTWDAWVSSVVHVFLGLACLLYALYAMDSIGCYQHDYKK